MAKKRRCGRPRALPVRVVPRAEGGTALEVGGVVQSVTAPPLEIPNESATPVGEPALGEPAPAPHDGYWGLMLPAQCPRRALLLGLGGGTVAWLLARRCPGVAMVGVERDAEVLAAGRESFGLDALPTLRIEEADAFEWVAARLAADETELFDLICLDLFQAGRMAQGALATPFLRQLAALLAPGGVLTVNLLVTARTPDHLRRLRRVFAVERELRLRGNLVVHARPASLSGEAEEGEES
jgi:SAM-dependent methyltransferase